MRVAEMVHGRHLTDECVQKARVRKGQGEAVRNRNLEAEQGEGQGPGRKGWNFREMCFPPSQRCLLNIASKCVTFHKWGGRSEERELRRLHGGRKPSSREDVYKDSGLFISEEIQDIFIPLSFLLRKKHS